MKKIIFTVFGGLLLIACNEHKTETVSDNNTEAKHGESAVHFTAQMIDNKMDPSCMMPTTAGVGDTLHYKNYVLGFCSKECKDDFLKNPEANLAAADLKKK